MYSAKAQTTETLMHIKPEPFFLTYIETPLGQMMIGANERGLSLLKFCDRRMLNTELKEFVARYKDIFYGENKITLTAKKQLAEYFDGARCEFTVPLDFLGTPFQKQAWKALLRIPYGQTISYTRQAERIGNTKTVRAVASANGKNKISIIVPCHRVIGNNGDLTGYGGGLERKAWLLRHEGALLL